MKEIYKNISNYIGLYQISNYGNVKSLRDNCGYYREKILKPKKDKNGYLLVCLHKNKNKKIFRIHRLVLETFIGPPPFVSAIVRHINNIPCDNYIDNIVWGTCKENTQDSIKNGTRYQPNNIGMKNPSSKLINDNILEIRKLYKENVPLKIIGNKFNITRQTIWRIVNEKNWKYIK